MFQHIATIRWRLAVDNGPGTGSQQAGPTQNGVAQGQCFADVVGGVVQSATDNFAGLAGAAAGAYAGGSLGGAIGAATAGLINASSAGLNAFNNSEACKELDNAAMANELGLGAIGAP
jgi:hypothetical protein